MRKISLVVLVVMVSFSLFFVGCSREPVNSEDIGSMRVPSQSTQEFVNNVDHWMSNQEVSELSEEDFLEYIYSQNPDLDLDVRRELLLYGIINRGEKISLCYLYFDDEGTCSMQDSVGQYTEVKFANKFVVEICHEDGSLGWMSLACLNGMLDISSDPVIWGDARMQFTIGEGKGLSYYLHDNYWSVRVAETFGLHVYEGRGYNERIDYDRARELADLSDTIQTTVKVRPGWKFILDRLDMQICIDGNWMTPAQFKEKYVEPYQ